MEHKEQENNWEELKGIWFASGETKEINFQMNTLMQELETMISPFEKDFIAKDIALITDSISQFELDSIEKDLDFLNRNLPEFEKKIVITGMGYVSKFLKALIAKIKGNKH